MLKTAIVLTVVISIIFSSCTKDDDVNTTKQELSYNENVQVAQIPIADLIINDGNIEDTQVNQYLFAHSNRLTAALLEKQLNSRSIGSHFGKEETIRIIELFDQSAIMKSGLSTEISYSGIDYDIGLRHYNKDNCNHELEPIVLIGTDVDVDGEGSFVPGFVCNSDGSMTNIIFNEQGAMQLENPIYIVVNGVNPGDGLEDPPINEPGTKKSESIVDETMVSAYSIRIMEEEIAYRYEGDRNSEYNVSHRIYIDGFTTMDWVRNHIRDIHKRDLNKRFYNQYLFKNYMSGFDPIDTFFDNGHLELYAATYEHDWYASLKDCWVNGKAVRIRPKYSSEYYQRIYLDMPVGDHYEVLNIYEKGFVKVLADQL